MQTILKYSCTQHQAEQQTLKAVVCLKKLLAEYGLGIFPELAFGAAGIAAKNNFRGSFLGV
jgi:hypothetical protein